MKSQDTYTVITDPTELNLFIQTVLPELEANEMFYCTLLARRKYVRDREDLPQVNSNETQLKRFLATKENLFSKIQQLEVPFGAYYQKDGVIPQEALALYICLNPRNLRRATHNSIKKMVDRLGQDSTYAPHSDAMSEISKSKSGKRYISFDFDFDGDNSLAQLQSQIERFINREAFHIVVTRGGVHVIVRPSLMPDMSRSTWYHQMVKLQRLVSKDVNSGDIMLPVPGTYQGGHTPYLYTLNGEQSA